MIHTFVASCVLAYCTQHWAMLVSKGHVYRDRSPSMSLEPVHHQRLLWCDSDWLCRSEHNYLSMLISLQTRLWKHGPVQHPGQSDVEYIFYS